MPTQEIYIRNATETEARGPFNVQQVTDLAEAGQVTSDTLIYDAGTEQWVALNTQPDLMAAVFPAKRKLELKARAFDPLNKTDTAAKPITVNEMLAAAEGRTTETKDKSDPAIAMARAARIGMIAAIVTLVLAAAAEILPSSEALVSMDPAKILAHPFVILGVADLLLAVFLALGVVTIYPLMRFRAALGLGLMGFTFYAQGLTAPLLYVSAGSVGLYLCTVSVTLLPAVLAGLAGVAGMAAMAWYFLSH
jgi:hypothetical protein